MEPRDYLSVGDNCHSSRDSKHLTQGVEERRGCEDLVGKRRLWGKEGRMKVKVGWRGKRSHFLLFLEVGGHLLKSDGPSTFRFE